jgi:hemolysin III
LSESPRAPWRYDRAEIWADGVVHVLGVTLGIAALGVLMVLSLGTVSAIEVTSVAVYGTGLVLVLCISAAYHLWPISPAKRLLRRFDHSAIYLLIAGTYTPIVAQMNGGSDLVALLVGVWACALAGIGLKLMYPDRFNRLSIALYLAIGWSGVLVYERVFALSGTTFWLIATGGVLYTVGVIFHVWESLRFQNAIWHLFVLAAAACHYGAVLDCVVLSRSVAG